MSHKLIFDLANEAYHARPEISSTGFREFLKSPAHFKAYLDSPREQTEAMFFGSMLHARVLEGKTVIAAPKIDKRTKEGKAQFEAWCAENSNKLIFDWFSTAEANQKAVDRIEGIARSVAAHPTVSSLLSEGDCEVSAVLEGAPGLKARFDWLRPDGIILDLKTTISAHPDAFEQAIFKYGYHIQAAWYSQVYQLVTGKDPEAFILIAAEKAPPFAVSVFLIKAETLQIGQDLIALNMPKLFECWRNDEWPGYPSEIREVGIPAWALNKSVSQLAEGILEEAL